MTEGASNVIAWAKFLLLAFLIFAGMGLVLSWIRGPSEPPGHHLVVLLILSGLLAWPTTRWSKIIKAELPEMSIRSKASYQSWLHACITLIIVWTVIDLSVSHILTANLLDIAVTLGALLVFYGRYQAVDMQLNVARWEREAQEREARAAWQRRLEQDDFDDDLDDLDGDDPRPAR